MARRLGQAARGVRPKWPDFRPETVQPLIAMTARGQKSHCLVADHIDPATKKTDDFDAEHDHEKVTACMSCNSLKHRYVPAGATLCEKLADAKRIVAERRKRQLELFQARHKPV